MSKWIVIALALSFASPLLADERPALQKIPGVDFTKPGHSPTPSPCVLSGARRSGRRSHAASTSSADGPAFGVGAYGSSQNPATGVGKVKIGF